MQISESWLREWVDPAVSSEELMVQITMAGLEVDGFEAAAPPFSGVVVAKVLSTEAHPDADKLTVCKVSDGTKTFQVVCGAHNVCAGLHVPFAKVGAVLDTDFKIRKAKLRGVESFGMLCSGEELGLEEKSEGLLELPVDAPVGTDIREYLQLDDTLIEVDLTPNRGDCLSIRGLSREVGVLNKARVKAPKIAGQPATIKDKIKIRLESPEDCPRYLGRVIRDINPGAESPLWLREKLRRCGLRAIDPVVDVTNYVLMELGHPMHAFDFDKLEGGIVVRRATKNEKLTLLDESKVKLREDTLVIADENKALAIAGVMGGLESSVTRNTSNILLESAFFSPLAIAGKSRSYGLQTDAAHRYERGVDYALAGDAMERATELLLQIVGGKAGPVVQAKKKLPADRVITLRESRIKKVLGLTLPAKEVKDILSRLGLEQTSRTRGQWQFSIPSWRFDLNIEEDLIEELARVYGYDNLPVSTHLYSAGLRSQQETITPLGVFRKTLETQGYQEVISYSFVDADLESALTGKEKGLSLLNPISSEMSVMRSSLWGGLIKTLKYNQNRQQNRVRLYESGLIFNQGKGKKITQTAMLGGIAWGSPRPEQWGCAADAVDFFDIKGDVEQLLATTLREESFSFVAVDVPALQKGQSAAILLDGKQVGLIGAMNPQLQKAVDVPGKVFLFELDLEAVSQSRLPAATPISRFPSIRRDIAMLTDENIETASIVACLKENCGENLTNVIIFDVYSGNHISKSKKSLALGLTFQHPSRTLTDDEINSIISSGINALQDKFNVELRT